mgnify:CR=1 FL=1
MKIIDDEKIYPLFDDIYALKISMYDYIENGNSMVCIAENISSDEREKIDE